MSDKATTQEKQSAPSGGADSNKNDSDSRRRSSTGGHEVTGAEKFVASGGSGGVPTRTGQGYEHYN